MSDNLIVEICFSVVAALWLITGFVALHVEIGDLYTTPELVDPIADKAWAAGWLARVNATKNNGKFIDKSTFMKSLFPETK